MSLGAFVVSIRFGAKFRGILQCFGGGYKGMLLVSFPTSATRLVGMLVISSYWSGHCVQDG